MVCYTNKMPDLLFHEIDDFMKKVFEEKSSDSFEMLVNLMQQEKKSISFKIKFLCVKNTLINFNALCCTVLGI